MDVTASLILAAVALVLLLVGRAIRGGAVWLVAGYRPDRVQDPAALARGAGGFALRLGQLLLVTSVMVLPGARAELLKRAVVVALAVWFVAALAREARRSLRPSERDATPR